MTLRIYGNRLPSGAPANLNVNAEGLQKLYGLANVNGHGEVTTHILTASVVQKTASADHSEDVPILKKDRPSA